MRRAAPGRRERPSPSLDPEDVPVRILEGETAEARAGRERLAQTGYLAKLERTVGGVEVLDLESDRRGVLHAAPLPPAVEAERDAFGLEFHPARLLEPRRKPQGVRVPARGALGILHVQDHAFDGGKADDGRLRRGILASHAPSSYFSFLNRTVVSPREIKSPSLSVCSFFVTFAPLT